jgi:hypothetical protein
MIRLCKRPILRGAQASGAIAPPSAPQDDDQFVDTALFNIDLPHLSLIPDRAEMFVDAEHDQDEFGGDA